MIAAIERRCMIRRPKALPRTITGSIANASEEQDAVAQWAEEIRALVESGRVGAARERLAKLPATQLEQPPLSKWAKALALPIVRVGAPGSTASISANAAWIRAHGQDYANEWVALHNGMLVGHNSSEFALRNELGDRNEIENIVFIYLRRG